MKVLLIHNEYAKFSGEEQAVYCTAALLRQHGHEVILFIRSSAEIAAMRFGKLRAFFSGIYNRRSETELCDLIARERPDIAQVQNVFPLISPAALVACRRMAVPVVMRVPNYRLTCPNGLFLSRGELCERCGGGREWWCVLRNCEENLPKSLGYALRSWVARRRGYFVNNVTLYLALTQFQRQKLVAAGFPQERIRVQPNMAVEEGPLAEWRLGSFVGFAGRLSPEKGVAALVEAARQCPEIPFRAAGAYDRMPGIERECPPNLALLGSVARDQMPRFYGESRFVVAPSLWYEGMPNTIIESMMAAKPVIASRIGGLPELVEEGRMGILVPPGDARTLAKAIRDLWNNPARCEAMGRAAREKATRDHSCSFYCDRLMDAYREATVLCQKETADSFHSAAAGTCCSRKQVR